MSHGRFKIVMDIPFKLKDIYDQRFKGKEDQRNKVWKILIQQCFCNWINLEDTVLDLGAGYCEFINNIDVSHKYALDLNPLTSSKAADDVIVLSEDITMPWSMASGTVNVVFTSNLFEHLPSKLDLKHCLSDAYRVLCPKGYLIAIGPNIRFAYDIYWDFIDHCLPLSDRSLIEAAEIVGFKKEVVIPRFLPYTMQSKLPSWSFLVRLYLKLPFIQKLLGKQFLVVASKS